MGRSRRQRAWYAYDFSELDAMFRTTALNWIRVPT